MALLGLGLPVSAAVQPGEGLMLQATELLELVWILFFESKIVHFLFRQSPF